jgi:APA family basic amino acid/polyamine antiporter
VLPVASVLFCVYLISGLPADTFLLFAGWIAAACLIYFSYSFRKSALIE